MKYLTVQTDQTRSKLELSAPQRQQMREWCKKYRRFKIEPFRPESRKQRGYYHGAICGMYAFFHERFDHRNPEDIKIIHELLKREYNGEIIVFNGETQKIGKSSKNELNSGYLERCIDGLVENYGLDEELLNPERYKHWRDAIYPSGGPNYYIDYLVDIGLLKNV